MLSSVEIFLLIKSNCGAMMCCDIIFCVFFLFIKSYRYRVSRVQIVRRMVQHAVFFEKSYVLEAIVFLSFLAQIPLGIHRSARQRRKRLWIVHSLLYLQRKWKLGWIFWGWNQWWRLIVSRVGRILCMLKAVVVEWMQIWSLHWALGQLC